MSGLIHRFSTRKHRPDRLTTDRTQSNPDSITSSSKPFSPNKDDEAPIRFPGPDDGSALLAGSDKEVIGNGGTSPRLGTQVSPTPVTDQFFGRTPRRDTFPDKVLHGADSAESTASGSGDIAPFEYSDHQLEPGWIRIFRLISGAWDEPLIGAMSSVKLELNHRPKSKYAAISFEWGSSNEHGEVLLDGKWLRIPVGLERALRQVRHTVLENPYWHHRQAGGAQTYSMDVWADAICIDQSNEDEKKLQIQMMGAIFQNADPLYIWLGYPSHADRLAMDTIKQLAAPFPVSRNTKLTNHPKQEYSQPDPESEKWIAIQNLLWKTYFNRSWIIQEIVQPSTKDLRVFCGSRWVQWDDIRIAIHLLRTHSWPRQPQYDWLNALEVPIDGTRDKFQKVQTDMAGHINLECSLSENLFAFRARQCRSPEDKIWSIRSICTDLESDQLLPQPGNKTSVGQIYLQATSMALRNCRYLDILSLCRQHDTEVYRPSSWVPDYWSYAQHPRARILAAQRDSSGKHIYQATAFTRPEVHISSDNRLRVRGVVVGRVAVTLTLPEWVGPCPADRVELLRWATLYCRLEGAWMDAEAVEVRMQRGRMNSRTLRIEYAADTRLRLWRFLTQLYPPSQSSNPEEETKRCKELGDFCPRLVADPFTAEEPSQQVASDLAAWQKLQTRRAVGMTDDGYLLQAPLDCAMRDDILLVKGARVPFVRDESGKLIGECRVEDHMDGKAWEKYIENDKVAWLHFK